MNNTSSSNVPSNTSIKTFLNGRAWNKLTLLERWDHTYSIYKDNINAHAFIKIALFENDLETLESVFKHLNIPQNLSIKEQISYYYLTKGN